MCHLVTEGAYHYFKIFCLNYKDPEALKYLKSNAALSQINTVKQLPFNKLTFRFFTSKASLTHFYFCFFFFFLLCLFWHYAVSSCISLFTAEAEFMWNYQLGPNFQPGGGVGI